jgi:hypothetical protein
VIVPELPSPINSVNIVRLDIDESIDPLQSQNFSSKTKSFSSSIVSSINSIAGSAVISKVCVCDVFGNNALDKATSFVLILSMKDQQDYFW